MSLFVMFWFEVPNIVKDPWWELLEILPDVGIHQLLAGFPRHLHSLRTGGEAHHQVQGEKDLILFLYFSTRFKTCYACI